MSFSLEDASIHTIPNPFSSANFGPLNFQFKYCMIFIKEMEEVLL